LILLTVGTQLPFDRLIRIMDDLAPTLATPVFAQTGAGEYIPKNMESEKFVRPMEFDTLLEKATLIVSHAGIGTFVMAQKHRKPLILFPRLASLNEHRNDHQLATVNALKGRQGVYVAQTAANLSDLLNRSLESPAEAIENPARTQLQNAIVDFIHANAATKSRRELAI
jgi:UDP-N-acetylglucosamine transferase subunit ALG13